MLHIAEVQGLEIPLASFSIPFYVDKIARS
jgi:hypothetical protein